MGGGMVAHAQVPTMPAVPPQAQTAAPVAPVDAKAAKKVRLQEAVRKVEQSLMVRITNLEGLAAKIQARIAKIQAEGKDMTLANTKLADAQKAIVAAKAELAILTKADTAMIASAKPATGFANIKNKTAKNVVVKIKAAHKALVDVIVIMKGQGTPGSATSTVQ
ncbi:TPA: hypothetical protein DDZ49_02445 [Candidatus Wolfebacteria bacterium]|nr:MAG: hypothetical protein UY00_C0044G0007 [Candidatus Wolfebacteria bacterium GW2011_GWA1_47_6]HAL24251.1 hypothetical protein [Candidatus Wolfebacteria bacterium]HBD18617.1 hypothetical protein [Candidatus Wolfebacteria bacterium]HBN87004.1 hypothetical protein [Candidatus Wolfebacteria bacterium]HBT74492.1 hypothetical protein [Candidatus Wolfebacteria bacterium]